MLKSLRKIWKRAILNCRSLVPVKSSPAAIHRSVLTVKQVAESLRFPKWEVVKQSRPLSLEEVKEHGPHGPSGVMKSWSEPSESMEIGARVLIPMRHRWDAKERIIYVERMAE